MNFVNYHPEFTLKTAETAVSKGREVLLQYFGRLSKIQEKEAAGLVSEADLESERVIKRELSLAMPEFLFLGEESGGEQAPLLPGQYRWILDPLDGTTNYVHQFPIFCISLALESSQGIELAVIDAPILQERFVARKGHGATCNGSRMLASQKSEIRQCFAATGFISENPRTLEIQIKLLQFFSSRMRAIRRAGAAAYDLSLCAKGVFDVFWEKGLQPWDMAAGILLVQEAGGHVVQYNGQPANPFCDSLIAGSPEMVKTVQGLVQQCQITD